MSDLPGAETVFKAMVGPMVSRRAFRRCAPVFQAQRSGWRRGRAW